MRLRKKDGATSADNKEEQEEDSEIIQGTPSENYLRPVRLRNKDNKSSCKKKEDNEEEESQSLLALAKKEERESLIFFGFNNRNVKKFDQ